MKRFVLINIFLSFIYGANLSIFSCIKICSEDEVKRLFDANASLISLEDEHRDTPLHYAVRYKKYRLLYYLVKKGADVSKIGANHLTPVDIAIQNGDKIAIKFLMLSPTFGRVKSKLVQEYLKGEGFDDIANEDFLDAPSDFQNEVKIFSDRVRERSKKKSSTNYIDSHYKHDNKSLNKGNVEVYIK